MEKPFGLRNFKWQHCLNKQNKILVCISTIVLNKKNWKKRRGGRRQLYTSTNLFIRTNEVPKTIPYVRLD